MNNSLCQLIVVWGRLRERVEASKGGLRRACSGKGWKERGGVKTPPNIGQSPLAACANEQGDNIPPLVANLQDQKRARELCFEASPNSSTMPEVSLSVPLPRCRNLSQGFP